MGAEFAKMVYCFEWVSKRRGERVVLKEYFLFMGNDGKNNSFGA